MSLAIEQIEKQVLALPAEERARLVDKLWASLGDTSYPILSEEWKFEIERRRRELLDGKVKGVPGEEVSRQAWQLAKGEKP
ncbi:MAG: addiction module protein [Verrucomicrobiales bacterium]|nr:addiction module protein [Verrucomicrobiales bacterium]